MIGSLFRRLPAGVFICKVCGRAGSILWSFNTVVRVCCGTVASKFHRCHCINDISPKVADTHTRAPIQPLAQHKIIHIYTVRFYGTKSHPLLKYRTNNSTETAEGFHVL